MKLFSFYNKSVYIQYRNQLCSTTTIVVCALTVAAIIAPYYLLASIKPGELWDEQRAVYEQPRVKFLYEYLFLAEMEDPEDRGSSIVTCSSFEAYNSLTEQLHPCNDVQVIPTDADHDRALDHVSVGISFNPPNNGARLSFYTIYFFLEATISSQCLFVVPAFILLEKVPTPRAKFESGTIKHHGYLEAKQTTPLQCPFFMRHQKSHFSDRYYPNENTTLEGFQPGAILSKIQHTNPAYYEYHLRRTDWTMDDSESISIQIDVSIGAGDSQKLAFLYKNSLWWKLCQFWGSYFPLLFVSLWLTEKIKQYLFENFYLRAVEVKPWKDKYN
ncbi:transmembrane protein 231 [Anopheles maculipalpis]|uniref:transmembrane protein 231 n=1 Tax=Anopheles maculipalpis TaxID=1496333 RepID=UPI002159340B|nr:transmembrane protein 231 [Anopheles maculipalpis]